MSKVVRLTESDLVRLVKRVILEQPQNPGFYDKLSKAGYTTKQNWSSNENFSKQINPVLKDFKPEIARNFVYFEKALNPAKSIRFVTDGAKIYFLDNQYGDGTLDGYDKGPHTVNKTIIDYLVAPYVRKGK
jgi:hypothetical protein